MNKYNKLDASIIFDTKLTLSENGLVIKKYSNDFVKIKDGFEPIEPIKPTTIVTNLDIADTLTNQSIISKKDGALKEITKRSLNKTRDKLIAYASQNAKYFHSFLTLTFKDDITDVTLANKKFQNFIKQCSRKYPNFKYLGTPEYQNNNRVHYHILTSLKCDIDIPKREPLRTYNHKHDTYITIDYYDIPYWIYGYSQAQNLDMTDDKFNVALYITKYLYKDIDNRLWGHNKILKSNNLEKPNNYYLKNNSDVYKQAYEYIESKGYDIKEYHYKATDSFACDTDIIRFDKISEEDYQELLLILQNEYKEAI